MSKHSTTTSTFIANLPVVGHRRTGDRPPLQVGRSRLRSQAGQATAEYGLVILAAAALAGGPAHLRHAHEQPWRQSADGCRDGLDHRQCHRPVDPAESTPTPRPHGRPETRADVGERGQSTVELVLVLPVVVMAKMRSSRSG